LREQGLSYAEVGRRLGISKQAAASLCRATAADEPLPPPEGLGLRAGATFGWRLRTCRLLAGLTRGQLARRAGVPRATVEAYEQGDLAPRQSHVGRLARVLGPGLLAGPPGEPPAEQRGV
jgi:transcriptional regulator with XRE-family HTH domain